MLRKLALGLAVSAALGVTQVHALGLGEIQLNSALNEPLDAEIKLTQVRDLSPLQIQPRIAASDEYTPSAAASQARYLRDIQFQVLVTPDGGGRIRLRSTEPIQEPFLNFMVEVNWPSGRMVREYTLLLDPPLFDQGAAQRRVQPAQAQPSAPVQPVAQARPSPRAGERAANIRTRMDPDTQVFVDVNDTHLGVRRAHQARQRQRPADDAGAVAQKPRRFPLRQHQRLASWHGARSTNAGRSGTPDPPRSGGGGGAADANLAGAAHRAPPGRTQSAAGSKPQTGV
jgi:pilus assembly protein FimV